MKTALLYGRVAADNQPQELNSLENQRKSMVKFCRSNSIKIDQVFLDDAVGGRDFNRPAYKAMKKYIKESGKKIDYILVEHWEKFARNLTKAVAEIAELQKLGVQVNCTSAWVDGTDFGPELLQKLLITMHNGISAKVKAGMRHAAKSGLYISRAPLGYVFIDAEISPASKGKRVGARRLLSPDTIHPEKIKFVKEAFSAASNSGEGLNSIRKRLVAKHGVQCGWNQFSQLLSNVTYTGLVPVPSCGIDKECVVGKHKALIDKKLFEHVQQIVFHKTVKI